MVAHPLSCILREDLGGLVLETKSSSPSLRNTQFDTIRWYFYRYVVFLLRRGGAGISFEREVCGIHMFKRYPVLECYIQLTSPFSKDETGEKNKGSLFALYYHVSLQAERLKTCALHFSVPRAKFSG
jgi:hypothetical protein